MLAIERRNSILAKLSAEGKVIVADLSREFGVTEETIRRDLEKLDHDGLAKKTYGGAVANEKLQRDLPFSVRKMTNVEQKQRIAEKIAGLIHDGDYIMLDASSTAIYVTRCIQHLKNITLITNSVEILLELADKQDWNVLSTGGSLKKGGLSLVGTSAERMIRSFHVDIAAADRKILAVDSHKFDKNSFVHVCDISEVDVIVTDQRPAEHWVEHCRDKNVELIY